MPDRLEVKYFKFIVQILPPPPPQELLEGTKTFLRFAQFLATP